MNTIHKDAERGALNTIHKDIEGCWQHFGFWIAALFVLQLVVVVVVVVAKLNNNFQ